MFSNPARLANIFMVMAALALCVSACSETSVDSRAETSYDSVPVTASVMSITHNSFGY